MNESVQRLIDKNILQETPEEAQEEMEFMEGYTATSEFLQGVHKVYLAKDLDQEENLIVRDYLRIVFNELMLLYEDEEIEHLGEDFATLQKHFYAIKYVKNHPNHPERLK